MKNLKTLVRLRNKAIEEEPYKLNECFSIDGEETSKNLDINSNNIKLKLAAIDKMILNRISKTYGEVAARIHKIPVLAKVKIIEISSEIYEGVPGLKASVTNYDAIVEDICRNPSILTLGKKITFYIIRQLRKTREDFEIGKSYFVGCFTIIDDFGEKRLALATNELNDGIYPIQNNKVIDYNNYLGIGNELSWDVFKKKLLNILILNQ